MTDLDAYFRRLRYDGPRAPTLATLNALSFAHVRAIPFENLDVLLGRPIELSPEAIEHKLLQEQRGGYCFEQNTLFLSVLLALGFEARPISARVRLDRPRDFTPPRTHLFTRVELDGQSYLADVGVGGLSLTGALRLELEREQSTPHEPRRIVYEDGRYFHQAKLGEVWTDVCEFTLEEMPPIDREVANWFTSAHPQSHFRNRLVCARATENGRISLLNRELKIRNKGAAAESRELRTPRELVAALDAHFGLRFPADTAFQCAALDFP